VNQFRRIFCIKLQGNYYTGNTKA